MITLDAITFDLDDTLWDNQGVMLKTEEGHYRWLLEALTAWRSARQEAPLPLTYEEGVEDYLKRRQQWAHQVPERRGDFTWLRLRALEAQLEEFNVLLCTGNGLFGQPQTMQWSSGDPSSLLL